MHERRSTREWKVRSVAGLVVGLGLVGCGSASSSPPTVATPATPSTTAAPAVVSSATLAAPSATVVAPSAAATPKPSVPPIANGLIAFASAREGKRQVFALAADGSALRRITNDAAADQPSAWSSDRSRLLFSSDRGGHDEIYVMNANGSAPKRLAASKIPASGAHWSPDGTMVVFNARCVGKRLLPDLLDAGGWFVGQAADLGPGLQLVARLVASGRSNSHSAPTVTGTSTCR